MRCIMRKKGQERAFMKYLLPKNCNSYKANLHCHTT